jgi:lambda family phage portal protein
VPWGVPVFMRLKDFDDYEDAQLVRQKIAACFTAFVHDSSGTGLDASTGLDKTGSGDIDLVDTFEPGAIEILPPGKDVKLANPPGVQNYGEYTSTLLHSIASGFDVPYEALTGDYSQVNYSSARMAWLQFGRDIDDWQNHMLIPQMCGSGFRWFLEALSLTGVNTSGARMKWIVPRRELLDPTKEVPAKIKEIRGGLTSRRRALREMGHNPDEINAEIEQDNAEIDAKGLVLDTDPRKVTAGGTRQKEEEEHAEEDEKRTG